MRLYLCGIDEAGRGPLAGPVTAAAVCLPTGFDADEMRDSKQLSAAERDRLFDVICKNALAYAVVSVGPRRIEAWNILEATKEAMRLAAARLTAQLLSRRKRARCYFLVDGNARLGTAPAHETIIKGDGRIRAIGAASILAKVTRDRLMERLEQRYPGFGFEQHKGYGTAMHRESIATLGPCRVHRRTFAGVREFCAYDAGQTDDSEAGYDEERPGPLFNLASG